MRARCWRTSSASSQGAPTFLRAATPRWAPLCCGGQGIKARLPRRAAHGAVWRVWLKDPPQRRHAPASGLPRSSHARALGIGSCHPPAPSCG